MAVNLKLGVDYSSFKQGLEQAQASVKTFDAALAKNEAQLKKTGDAEEYMRQKSAILQQQIEAQRQVVDQYKSALQKMQDAGDVSSKAFQTMTTNLMKAETKLIGMETDLKNVGKESQNADTELKKIGKGVSWENVTNGLKTITDQLERGARAAVNFGKKVARSAMDSTSWADDILTRATQYGIDAETLQKMENVADYIDTDVDTIISARDRLAKNRDSLPDLLGISADGKSTDDLFWEVGEAIMNLGEAFDKSEVAQKVFGRGWRELLPLFTTGREAYEGMMNEQNVLTNEQVENLGKADDAIQSFQQQIELMKNQFWAENADKITELLQWLIDNKDGVVAALTAIAGAFAAIKIGEFALNLKKVTDGLGSLFGKGGTPTATGTGGGGGGSNGWLSTGWASVKSALVEAAPLMAKNAAVIGAAILPAVIANNATYAASTETMNRRLAVAGASSDPRAAYLAEAAAALEIGWGNNADFGTMESLLMGLKDSTDEQKAVWQSLLSDRANSNTGNYLWTDLQSMWDGTLETGAMHGLMEGIAAALEEELSGENAPNVELNPVVPADAAAEISAMIGTVPVSVAVGDYAGLASLSGSTVGSGASNVASRNFSSNLYVESMIMNNGADAAGLAASMAAAQRRTMTGFGS